VVWCHSSDVRSKGGGGGVSMWTGGCVFKTDKVGQGGAVSKKSFYSRTSLRPLHNYLALKYFYAYSTLYNP